MYAVIVTGGKQYRVAEGDVIEVEKLDAQVGDKVELPVLMRVKQTLSATISWMTSVISLRVTRNDAPPIERIIVIL